jgi:16S rRNA (cytosine967-C5)-methyltransferase
VVFVGQDVNLRAVVLDILIENEKNPGHSHVVLRQALGKYQYLDKPQRAFITRLAEGAVERRLELDYRIDRVSRIKTADMKPVIRNILRMSFYQMEYMDNVPVSAVCNEAVKLVGKRGFASLKGFVNGVLRNAARGMGDMGLPDPGTDFYGHCSVKYSMPEWLVRHFVAELGEENAVAVLEGFQKPRNTYIRCNIDRVSPHDLKEILENEGIKVENTVVPYAFRIWGYDYLEGLESFRRGYYQVQDLSSILSGLLVTPAQGDFILDVCAAPGGKCIHAAQRLGLMGLGTDGGSVASFAAQNSAVTVEARDVSEAKVALIEDNLARLGVGNVTTRVWDATVKDAGMCGRADWLIADVPCSGLGMLGRKADIRYTITEAGIKDLVALQRRILSASADYVRPGGMLVYSTCTINRGENEDNVAWLMENHPYELVSQRLLLPGVDDTDGFFMAKLRRRDMV